MHGASGGSEAEAPSGGIRHGPRVAFVSVEGANLRSGTRQKRRGSLQRCTAPCVVLHPRTGTGSPLLPSGVGAAHCTPAPRTPSRNPFRRRPPVATSIVRGFMQFQYKHSAATSLCEYIDEEAGSEQMHSQASIESVKQTQSLNNTQSFNVCSRNQMTIYAGMANIIVHLCMLTLHRLLMPYFEGKCCAEQRKTFWNFGIVTHLHFNVLGLLHELLNEHVTVRKALLALTYSKR
jgi:hypothetical protein